MQVSRQQRRAAERSKEKRRIADVKAGIRAKKRIALINAWRKRTKLTRREKFWFVAEGLFYILGGPLVWMFYNVGWWRKKTEKQKGEDET